MPVYLDFNATTPVHPEVLELMIHVYRSQFGNASSRTHIYGQEAKRIVDESRAKIANLLGISPTEVVFTSGATESNNLAILGLEDYGRKQRKLHIISTNIEHNSILEPLKVLSRRGFDIELCPVDSAGLIDAEDLLRRVRTDTLLVTVMHANNETGVLQPVDVIGTRLKEMGVLFHVDASQTFGKLSKEILSLDYDLMSITAHKVYGPQGIGALILRHRNYVRPPLTPLLHGGGQENGLRPGTLPVALIAGFGKAAELAQLHGEKWLRQEARIKQDVLDQLRVIKHVINGDQTHCLPNCVNVSFPGIDSEALMLATRTEIAISNGSACTSSKYRPSHVLEAMGALAESAVRLSWGPQIDSVDLEPIITFVRQMTQL
ncbi:cysteine desulfurase DndA [Kyrpidia spormannii]|uniref:cysteine desulfurase n=1 Tax=Kyrpidia spormannii TaxID=2055160 RepID=A0A2K8N535_9BACL|nr:aminotransferase class V-fold PLP-dependent enzyme [Kyrpidia spormannii]ATY84459.1 cysteine desulfurase DndA [Kyrpidia spormannii]